MKNVKQTLISQVQIIMDVIPTVFQHLQQFVVAGSYFSLSC